MANGEIIAYNVASFICALCVLEFGADEFIDHTTIVSQRTSISPALIGLLTAGAEWEELVIVIASIARNRPSLAIGNIIGSTISNILGAFSLGLLFHSREQRIEFDRSSRIYSLCLLLFTGLATLLFHFSERGLKKTFGVALLILFVFYTASVVWAISRGLVNAPEASDTESSDGVSDTERIIQGLANAPEVSDEGSPDGSRDTTNDIGETRTRTEESERGSHETPTVPSVQHHDSESQPLLQRITRQRDSHSLQYHLARLLLGFTAICISGYVLAHASTAISDEIGVSDLLFGVVFLSIATTLPEKFIAVLSGTRGYAGILVANTVGSNIFLLTLCLGILLVAMAEDFDAGSVHPAEVGVMMGSTVALTATVWVGARWGRLIGVAMLIGYVVFLGLEFTVIRKSGLD